MHRQLGGTGIGIPLHAGRRDAHRVLGMLDGLFFLLLFDALELGLLRTVHAKVVTGTTARQDGRQHADGDQCSLLTVLLGALRTRCARAHVVDTRHVDRRHIGRQVAGARYRSGLSIALLRLTRLLVRRLCRSGINGRKLLHRGAAAGAKVLAVGHVRTAFSAKHKVLPYNNSVTQSVTRAPPTTLRNNCHLIAKGPAEDPQGLR